jgi:hypothetical protein
MSKAFDLCYDIGVLDDMFSNDKECRPDTLIAQKLCDRDRISTRPIIKCERQLFGRQRRN